jgi:hypothetical protein
VRARGRGRVARDRQRHAPRAQHARERRGAALPNRLERAARARLNRAPMARQCLSCVVAAREGPRERTSRTVTRACCAQNRDGTGAAAGICPTCAHQQAQAHRTSVTEMRPVLIISPHPTPTPQSHQVSGASHKQALPSTAKHCHPSTSSWAGSKTSCWASTIMASCAR